MSQPGRFSPLYQARILLQRIPDSETLDQRLSMSALTEEQWQSIGACIARFHQHNIFHADLNASNILLDSQQKIYLIDFDKGEQRVHSKPDATWKKENLQRLKRSLLKQQGIHGKYYFDQQSWAELLQGYGSGD